MIEKYSATTIQLENVQKIMRLLDSSNILSFTDGTIANVEINKAYLRADYSVKLDELSDNPEDNAGFVNINNCAYYIHFGTLINSCIDEHKICFPKNKIPIEYKELNLDYLYLDTDLFLVIDDAKINNKSGESYDGEN